jgi:cellulose synthase/poly-beta-1,6-N-acetylglucosamine synthase-like glycosyltransferase
MSVWGTPSEIRNDLVPSETQGSVRVGVYINAHNERENISRAVESVLGQHLNQKFGLKELVLIVDGSTDGTDLIAKKLSSTNSITKHIITREREGKVACFNKVLIHSRANSIDIAVFPMADTFLGQNALGNLLRAFNDHNVGGACGRVVPMNDSRTLTGRLVQTMWGIHNLVLSKHPKLNGEFYAIRPSLVDSVPRFVPWEDSYLEIPITREGRKIRYVKEAVAYMYGPSSLRELFKQRMRIHVGIQIIRRFENYTIPTSNVTYLAKAIVRTISDEGVTSIPPLAICIMMEGWAKLTGYVNYRRGRVPFRWERLGSTKHAITEAPLGS